MSRRSVLLTALLPVFLASCSLFGGERVLPVGEQVIRGVLTPVSVSLDRRGTHLVSSGSVKIAYAESRAVNLREIENKSIELVGTFEQNLSKKDLPVFVVTAVHALNEDSRSWLFPSLSLAIRAPSTWSGKLNSEGQVIFTSSGSSQVYLTVARASYESSPFAPKSLTGSQASASSTGIGFLGSFRAARQRFTDSHYRLSLDLGSFPSLKPEERVLVFDFVFPSGTAKEQAPTILAIEESIRIGGMPSSVGSVSSKPSSAAYGSAPMPGTGAPCGGSAGVLCPQGQYCAIEDRKENVGHCKMR
jgi:hypothetical protein